MTLRPVLAILFLAPLLGESLSTASPPLDVLLWAPVLVPLYGCGALLVREVTRRHRLGTPGLVLLGAAYGVYEEALVDGYWFDPAYAGKVGVGDYSRVWHTSLLLATHLTAFHVVVSIGASIVLVERLFPGSRDRPWLRRRWLPLPALALASVPFLTWGTYERGPIGPVVACGVLCVLLIEGAFRVRWSLPANARHPGLAAFACSITHVALVYSVPHLGVPWPVGLLLSLAPIALGARLCAGAALAGVTGVLSVGVLVAGAVGLGGRYDLTVFAVAMGVLLRRLNRLR